MATNRHRILVSFTREEEWPAVQALAGQLRLDVSELLRRLVLGQRLPDASHFEASQAILDLMKVNADQARLGNLLKLVVEVGDADLPPETVAQIGDLVADLRQVQATIKEVAKTLHQQVHPRSA